MRMITLSFWTTYSFLEENASLPHPSKSQGVGTDDAVPIHTADQVHQEDLIKCDKLLSDICYVTSTVMSVKHVSFSQ